MNYIKIMMMLMIIILSTNFSFSQISFKRGSIDKTIGIVNLQGLVDTTSFKEPVDSIYYNQCPVGIIKTGYYTSNGEMIINSPIYLSENLIEEEYLPTISQQILKLYNQYLSTDSLNSIFYGEFNFNYIPDTTKCYISINNEDLISMSGFLFEKSAKQRMISKILIWSGIVASVGILTISTPLVIIIGGVIGVTSITLEIQSDINMIRASKLLKIIKK